ncbi:MAG: 3-phosphoshikimate 1-carboxyvinyltransferase [Candidatus Devosia symbiotica]|nr:3-phosphoshikimate 1-carboxyvinyltransferase [Candidatus Devosia symbiotica]
MTEIKPSSAPLTAHGADPLRGRFVTPSDASISQRALLLAALSLGESSIVGLRASPEVLSCVDVLRQLGVRIEQSGESWQVHGLGVVGLLQPETALKSGHSADGLALLLGLLAPYGFATLFSASPTLDEEVDSALLDGLGAIGARVEQRNPDGITLQGACLPLPVRQKLTTPSEVVKTALLLAGLQIAGDSEIYEAVATRDHTEKLLVAFGADITVTPDADDSEGATIRLVGLPELASQVIKVAGDPSAAAFAIVAALIIKGSELLVENVLINPLRTGLIDTLLEMGGNIEFLNQHETAGEHVADLRVRSSWLKGVRVNKHHASAMADDIPALAMAAAFAEGETVIEGFVAPGEPGGGRLEWLAAGLRANKVNVRTDADSLTIVGDSKVPGGGSVDSHGDAAIAMGFAVLGLASRHKVIIQDASAIVDSFPDFVAIMTALGGRFLPNKGR